MENIKFLVVEPERGHHNYIIEKLQSRAYQNISVIEHLNELKYFTEDELPDIMICNYKLGDNYTIHHVFEINTLLSKVPCIVYSLQYNENILKNLNSANIIDFLPIEMSGFELEKAVHLGYINSINRINIKNKFKNYILVRSGKEAKKLKLSDIMYIGVDGKYIELHSTDKRYFVRFTLSSILEKLPENFVKIHKAYVINTDYLDTINIEDNTIRIGKENLPLSRSYKKVLFDNYYIS